MALERVRAQKPSDSPILLITLLNANLPEKYRPNVVVSDDTTAKQLLAKLGEGAKRATAPDTEPVADNVMPLSRVRRNGS